MRSFFNKKTIVLCLAFVAVTLLALSAARGQNRYPLMSRIAGEAMRPFDFVFSRVAGTIQEGQSMTRDMGTLFQENKQLKAENADLRKRVFDLTEQSAENERLRVMLDFRNKTSAFQLKTAAVIGKDPGILNFSIRINAGLQDGIRPNMPVVTPNGLVGHVTEVFSGTSKVKLLIDSTSAAASMVQRPQSRAVGIIEGLAAPTTGLRMKNLTRDADIIKGDKVMTSGFGGIYPKGLLIGEVADVADDDGGLLKHAVIKPMVDYDRLEEVFVVTGEKKASTP